MLKRRISFVLPLVMCTMFAVAFVRAELRWRACSNDEFKTVCFSYPNYLRYETRQALDLHWLMLSPAAALGQLPDSLRADVQKGTHQQWLRYAATAVSVAVCWCLVGLWWKRLLSGGRLPSQRRGIRIGIWVVIVMFAAMAGLALYLGIRGGYEGSTMTDAGLVLPSILIVMALTELGVVPQSLRKIGTRTAIAILFLCLYVWTDSAYRTEHQQYEERAKSNSCRPEPGAVCFSLPFMPSPLIQDSVGLQMPATLIASVPSMLLRSSFSFDSSLAIGFRYSLVLGYWFIVMSLVGGEWPSATKAYGAVRIWLFVLCAIVFAFSFLSWLVAGSPHGPNGIFGLVVGTTLALYALRRISRRSEVGS
jgi:hypothetical protein